MENQRDLRPKYQCLLLPQFDGILPKSIEKSPAGFENPGFFYGSSDPIGQGLVIIETSRSLSDTAHLVGILWTSDELHAGSL